MPNTTIKQKKKKKEDMRNVLRKYHGMRDVYQVFEDLYKTIFTNRFKRKPVNVCDVVTEEEALNAVQYLMTLYGMQGIVASKHSVLCLGDKYHDLWNNQLLDDHVWENGNA